MSTLYGIEIDGDATYTKEIEAELTKLARNPVGSVILIAIAATKKDMKIVPYSKKEVAAHGKCNAVARANKPRDAAPDGVRPYGRDGRQPYGKIENVGGTGSGSDATVHFTANMWGGAGCFKGGYGSLPDEILFHELVHGLRDMQGLSNAVPMSGSRHTNYDATRLLRYENEEEFLAIVATNVYMSAKGSTNFRADHLGHTALQPPLNTSVGFLADKGNHEVMSIYQLVWRPTFAELSNISTPFNPFRQLTADLAYRR